MREEASGLAAKKATTSPMIAPRLTLMEAINPRESPMTKAIMRIARKTMLIQSKNTALFIDHGRFISRFWLALPGREGTKSIA